MMGLIPKLIFCAETRMISRVFCLAQKNCFYENHLIRKTKSNTNLQLKRFLSSATNAKIEGKKGLLDRFRKTMLNTVSDKNKIKYAGRVVYERCADNINYKELFDYFQLKDSFHSWFLCIELHVWMCISIGIAEDHGRIFRNSMVDAMWLDIENRLSTLKEEIPSAAERKKYLIEINDQFKAALIAYDEGLLCDDTVLAAAIWRTLFSYQNLDPRILEKAVFYVRKQVSHLNSLNTEDFMMFGTLTFLPVNSFVSER